MLNKLSLKISVVFFLLFPTSVYTYVSNNVPITNITYRYLDILEASGLVKSMIFGERPFSRQEVIRIYMEAKKNFTKLEKDFHTSDLSPKESNKKFKQISFLKQIFSYFNKKYNEDIKRYNNDKKANKFAVGFLEDSYLNYTYLGEPYRDVIITSGMGTVNARVNHLVDYNEGRHFAQGSAIHLETTHHAQISPYLSFYGQPLFTAVLPTDSSSSFKATAHKLYLKTGINFIQLLVGREHIIGGQGEHGGTMFSSNARPLDMIKLYNPHPFRFPWIFKYIGAWQIAIYVANLGPERALSYPYLYGWRFNFMPVHWLEFVGKHAVYIGGNGAPAIRWHDPIQEFFGFRGGTLSGKDDDNVTNRLLGWECRFTIPWLRNSQLYLDGTWEDMNRYTWYVNLTQQLAFVSGWYSPRLNYSGTLGFRFEYIYIPPILYHHGTWTDGHTLNKNLLGSPLDPDTNSLTAKLYWFNNNKLQTNWSCAYLNIDSDIYRQTTSPRGGPDKVEKVTDNITEHHFQFGWEAKYQMNNKLSLSFKNIYDYINNFNFTGAQKFNVLFNVGVNYNFDL